jgi:recombination protein RecA
MPPCPTLESVIGVIKATIRRAKEIRKKSKLKVPIVIIVDSLNACRAYETLETPTGKKRYPAEARIWSEELPSIVEDLESEHVALVFVSQVRKKMNVMFGSDEEMAGGNAPKFYASLIVYVTLVGTMKDGDKTKVGSDIETECKKNQIGPPFRKARFAIYWNRGIDYEHSLVLQLEEMGVVKKHKKGRLTAGKVELGQGYAAAAKALRERPKLNQKLVELFYKRMGWELAA